MARTFKQMLYRLKIRSRRSYVCGPGLRLRKRKSIHRGPTEAPPRAAPQRSLRFDPADNFTILMPQLLIKIKSPPMCQKLLIQ